MTVKELKDQEAWDIHRKKWDDLTMREKIEMIDILMTTFACHEVREMVARTKKYAR